MTFNTVLILISKRHLRKVSKELTEAVADLSAVSYESLSSIRTIQTLGLETTFYNKLKGHIITTSNLQIKSTLLSGGFAFVSLLVTTIGIFIYGWYGWSQVLQDNLSLGSYMAFTVYVGFLYGPIENLISIIQQVELTLIHINRFLDIYELEPEIQDAPSMPHLPKLGSAI